MTRFERLQLIEHARSRNEICDKCEELGQLFIEHFHKIYCSPDDINVNHWISEMNSWYNKCKNFQFKHNNKKVSISNLFDWFFTCSKSVDELFDNEEEADTYNDFLDEFMRTRDVRTALEDIGLIDISY